MTKQITIITRMFEYIGEFFADEAAPIWPGPIE